MRPLWFVYTIHGGRPLLVRPVSGTGALVLRKSETRCWSRTVVTRPLRHLHRVCVRGALAMEIPLLQFGVAVCARASTEPPCVLVRRSLGIVGAAAVMYPSSAGGPS